MGFLVVLGGPRVVLVVLVHWCPVLSLLSRGDCVSFLVVVFGVVVAPVFAGLVTVLSD